MDWSSMDAPSQQWVTRAPAVPLLPFVDRYIGYRLSGFPHGLHRGLPSDQSGPGASELRLCSAANRPPRPSSPMMAVRRAWPSS